MSQVPVSSLIAAFCLTQEQWRRRRGWGKKRQQHGKGTLHAQEINLNIRGSLALFGDSDCRTEARIQADE